MHSYFANLYEIECASQHYHRTLENISIWDITLFVEIWSWWTTRYKVNVQDKREKGSTDK